MKLTAEERVLKVLAGLYYGVTSLHLGTDRYLIRSDINAGIIRLGFKAHNEYQMGKDLEFLTQHHLVVVIKDDNKIQYKITNKGQEIAKNIISVWNAFGKGK